MSGALNLTEPSHLLAKLSHEINLLTAEPRNSYAAINALRDAYHLREWIWHGRLKTDPVLQAQITAGRTQATIAEREDEWKEYVSTECPNFSLIQELCNGSKHFRRMASDKVQAAHTAGYGSPLLAYNTGPLGYNVDGLFMQLDGGRIVSMMYLLQSVRKFWAELFDRYPQLV
jgi:hypothetical protein